ncbi:hypothetical protein E2562_014743 [Oryza meyeriana var. granulata]|uniref:Uncharacterized protein n=1 Tax=Oryza meyeriana var. granulata TaxID=110450 RepID=A0A6G1BKF2_9ORYZ|nr:hypothetical protein E2562_014743 [Oryza meyeriana var. granulata]
MGVKNLQRENYFQSSDFTDNITKKKKIFDDDMLQAMVPTMSSMLNNSPQKTVQTSAAKLQQAAGPLLSPNGDERSASFFLPPDLLPNVDT